MLASSVMLVGELSKAPRNMSRLAGPIPQHKRAFFNVMLTPLELFISQV